MDYTRGMDEGEEEEARQEDEEVEQAEEEPQQEGSAKEVEEEANQPREAEADNPPQGGPTMSQALTIWASMLVGRDPGQEGGHQVGDEAIIDSERTALIRDILARMTTAGRATMREALRTLGMRIQLEIGDIIDDVEAQNPDNIAMMQEGKIPVSLCPGRSGRQTNTPEGIPPQGANHHQEPGELDTDEEDIVGEFLEHVQPSQQAGEQSASSAQGSGEMEQPEAEEEEEERGRPSTQDSELTQWETGQAKSQWEETRSRGEEARTCQEENREQPRKQQEEWPSRGDDALSSEPERISSEAIDEIALEFTRWREEYDIIRNRVPHQDQFHTLGAALAALSRPDRPLHQQARTLLQKLAGNVDDKPARLWQQEEEKEEQEVEQEADREEEEGQEPTQYQGNQGEQQWWGTWWQGGSHTTWDDEDAWQQKGKDEDLGNENAGRGDDRKYLREYDQQRERSPPEPTREEWLRFQGAWWRKIVSSRPDGADEIWACSDPRLKQQRGRVEGRWLWRDSEKAASKSCGTGGAKDKPVGVRHNATNMEQVRAGKIRARGTARTTDGGSNIRRHSQHGSKRTPHEQEKEEQLEFGEPARQHNQYEGYRRWGPRPTRVPPRPKNYVPKDDDKAKDGEEEDDDASYVQTSRKKQGGEPKGKGKRKEVGKVTTQRKREKEAAEQGRGKANAGQKRKRKDTKEEAEEERGEESCDPTQEVTQTQRQEAEEGGRGQEATEAT